MATTKVDSCRMQTARRLLVLHREYADPADRFPIVNADGAHCCCWCLKVWPCPDVRWSQRAMADRPSR